jgi:CheY-like chemotaxis protein
LARKILLADDSVTAQNMGRKILADAGYEVIAVNNGSAALKKILELKPDLVILDVYMPGYSGLEVCQRLKESPETARIPVLLSVGKLEPFKPEEAQRVRAEGFIVKPFEASELLSTLSKLEDKVVPRSEPSKPGRFARAIAAAEEIGRGGRNETAGDENGWKSRIGFPKQKTEPEEKVEDEASIYNPMNRDLRTVVEKPAVEKAAGKEETRQPAGEVAETNNVDVAAMAPAGLPKDVTPEEVAAIAAAAAQIQMAGAATKDERQVSDGSFSEPRVSEVSQASPERAPNRVEAPVPPRLDAQHDSAPRVEVEARPEALAENKLGENREEGKIESIAGGAAAADAGHRLNGDAGSEETQDVPVTMAATAESVAAAGLGASRWTAVPVALEGEEATISLDQEMRKAYAAFVAEEKDSAAAATVPDVVAASAKNSSTRTELEVPVAATSNPEPEFVPEPELAGSAAAVTAEVTPVEARAEASPAPDAEPAMVETAAASSIAFSLIRSAEYAAEAAAEPKEDSETVKSTAAAWASWRQTRDISKDSEVAEAEPREKEFDEPEPAPAETAARAVAAGAEQIPQEVSAAAPSGDQNNVASIVDSVLADLRPKLMEEISRKMSEKK